MVEDFHNGKVEAMYQERVVLCSPLYKLTRELFWFQLFWFILIIFDSFDHTLNRKFSNKFPPDDTSLYIMYLSITKTNCVY